MNDNRWIISALVALLAAGAFAAMIAFRSPGLSLPERNEEPPRESPAAGNAARTGAGTAAESSLNPDHGADADDDAEDVAVETGDDPAESDAAESTEPDVVPMDPDSRVEWKLIRRLAACEREFEAAVLRGGADMDQILTQKFTAARTATLMQEYRIYKEYGDDRETSPVVLIEYARAGLIGDRRDISDREKAALTREAGVLRETYALIDGEQSASVARRRAQKLGAANESFKRLAGVLGDDVDMQVYDMVFKFPDAPALHLIGIESAESKFTENFHREFRMAAQDRTALGAQVRVMLEDLAGRHRVLNDEAKTIFGDAFVLGRTPRDLTWPPETTRAFFLVQFKRAALMSEVCANFYRDLYHVLGARGKRFESVRETEWLKLLNRL